MTEENHAGLPALYAALAKAQGEFQKVMKNRSVQIKMTSGGSFKFDYADLDQLISCTRPALSRHGLAVIQIIAEGELRTSLVHASGGCVTSAMKLPSMGQDPKAFGAAISYERRYSYSALLCLAADDDLEEDGQEAGQAPRPAQRPAQRAEQGPRGQEPSAPAGDEQASQGEINWARAKVGKLDADAGLALLAKHGIKGLDAGVSKSTFLALKADLLKA